MAKKKQKSLRRTYIREWRKHRDLNQNQLAERVGITQGAISDLETGKFAYVQPLLESIANALNCEPWDLLWRPPGASDELREVIESLSPDEQAQAVAVVKALKSAKAA